MSSANPSQKTRAEEISDALRKQYRHFVAVGVFSGVINVLALTGSIYMLQVYDRVIPSRSLQTLVGLTVLMVGLYLANGLLDMLRSRVMSRIGLKFDEELRTKIFDAVLVLPLHTRRGGDGLQPIRDIDQIRGFLSSPGPTALFDMPWMPVFLFIIYMLHPWLGMLATAGAVILFGFALITEFRSRAPAREAAQSGSARMVFSESARRGAEVIRAMGMGGRMQAAWMDHSRKHLMDQRNATDVVGGMGAFSKVMRMILQSAMLGLGALLVVYGQATAGVMIAGSILLSRALAPVEVAIANWRGFVAARQSYSRLKQLFAVMPSDNKVMQLEPPKQKLAVQGLWVAPPGEQRAIVQNISFDLQAGNGLGIIGPSASGKTTLARALVGVWQPIPQRGAVRLDGAALDQWAPDELGKHIGYLPQDIELFEGTVQQNIARFDPNASSESIIEAARIAGVYDMIVQLPQGFETRIGESGAALSAGQRQRVGLARAVYGNPFLVVLDEPNSNLDGMGEMALSAAIKSIRARGGIVIVIAHRPSALAELDLLLAMANGQAQAFGPKDEVLQKVTKQQPPPGGRPPPGSPPPRSGPPGGAGPQAERLKVVSRPPDN